MYLRRIVSLAIGALLLCGGVALSRSLEESDLQLEVLAEGSTLPANFIGLTATRKGVTGNFEFGATRIVFETRRGPRTPPALRAADPGTPSFEIDIRFLDENGVPFLVQYGGHGPIEKSWATEFEAGSDQSHSAPLSYPDELSAEQARARLTAAAAAIKEIEKIKFDPAFSPERKALLQLSPVVQSLLAPEKIEEVESVYGASGTCTYRHKIQIHDKPFTNYGRHSGTITKNVLSGTTVLALVMCNHGTCPQNMPLKCSWTSSPNRCKLTISPECKTKYNVTSIWGHNCNDDTAIQYGGVRGAYTPDPSRGTCSDSAPRRNSPSCS